MNKKNRYCGFNLKAAFYHFIFCMGDFYSDFVKQYSQMIGTNQELIISLSNRRNAKN